MSGPRDNPSPPIGPRVFIDASWLAHKAKHAMGHLSFQGDGTGIIFGCLQQILTVCTNPRVKSNRVGLFFDGPKNFCLRRKAYPPYKKRPGPKTPEDRQASETMLDQLRELRKTILPAIGIPVYRQIGLEADDLMAQAAVQTDRAGERGIIITADGDLWQCVSNSIHWYDPTPGRDLYMDRERLFSDHRVGPAEWGEVKCIAGCSTDNVAGIPGVGVKTATDWVWGLLPLTSKKLETIKQQYKAVVRRNGPLVRLPHKQTKDVVWREPEYDVKTFFDVAREYGFQSYLDGPRRAQWEMLFRGDLAVGDMQAAKVRRRGE